MNYFLAGKYKIGQIETVRGACRGGELVNQYSHKQPKQRQYPDLF